MAEVSQTRSDFKFILNSVRSDATDAVAHELTQLFPLDRPTAAHIAKTAPIILLDNLTPLQARKVGTYAIRLRALGADVQVTGQPVRKLQVLRWPLLPDIAKRPGNHVICPNCGARLQLQVFMPLAEGKAEEPETPAGEPGEPAPAVAIDPAPGDAAPTAGEEVIEEVLLEPLAEDEAGPITAPEAGGEAAEEAPAMEIASEPTGGIGGEGTYRVTLVGKVKRKKKQQAAELMAQYLGIEQDEALSRLNRRSVVTVATGLTEEQAGKCQKDFAAIGIKVTVKG